MFRILQNKLRKKLQNAPISVMDHFHAILSKSDIGRKSSFGEHICFTYAVNSLQHHDYVDDFDNTVLGMGKSQSDCLFISKNIKTVFPVDLLCAQNSCVPVDTIVQQNELAIHVIQPVPNMYETDDCLKMQHNIKEQLRDDISTVQIDMSFLQAPTR